MLLKIFGASFGDQLDRESRSIRGDDRAGFANGFDALKKFALDLRFSATASMIQSAWPHQAMLSSRFPGMTRRAVSGVKNAAGLDFFAASSPARRCDCVRPDFRGQGLCAFLQHLVRMGRYRADSRGCRRWQDARRFLRPSFRRRAQPPFRSGALIGLPPSASGAGCKSANEGQPKTPAPPNFDKVEAVG